MHIAYTQKAWNVAPLIFALLCAALFSASTAHAQVTAEESKALEAQLSIAQEQVAGLLAHQGKVLGVSTLALAGSSYSGSYSSILEQIEALRAKVQSYKSNSSYGSDDDNPSYNTGSYAPWGHETSNAARKAALEKQIQQIDARITELTKQKAELQTQLDKLNASSTDTSTNPRSSKAISLSHESDSAVKDGSKGVFTMKFEVKAKESDVFIKESTVQNAIFKKTAGVNFVIQKKSTSSSPYSRSLTVVDPSQHVVTTGSVDATLTSDATKSGNYFKVEEGESETFTLTVTYTPAKAGSYQMRLMSVNWNTTAADAAKRTTARSSDFTTDALAL